MLIKLSRQILTSGYDKRDDFSLPILHFPFMDADITMTPLYGVYLFFFLFVRFARIFNKVSGIDDCTCNSDDCTCNSVITDKL